MTKLFQLLRLLVFNQDLKIRYEFKIVTYWMIGFGIGLFFAIIFYLVSSGIDWVWMQQVAIAQGLTIGFIAATFISYLILSEKQDHTLTLGLKNKIYLKGLTGFGVGLVVMGFIILAIFFTGGLSRSGSIDDIFNIVSIYTATQLMLLITFSTVAEELMFRGYTLQVDYQHQSRWYRIILLSIVYVFIHLWHSEISLIGIINFFLIGVWLSLSTIRANTVWYAVGLHLGWNACMVVFAGLPNTGQQYPMNGLLNLELSPDFPVIITGGEFGPEGSLITTLVLLLLSAYEMKRNP